jgi:hypothetical protein
MQASAIIDELDELCPNQYGGETKLRWLADLDGKVYHELIETRDDPYTQAGYENADYDDEDVELLIPQPWARDLYLDYLRARIAEADAETERYNLYAAAYNAVYREYSAWYLGVTPAKRQRGWRY